MSNPVSLRPRAALRFIALILAGGWLLATAPAYGAPEDLAQRYPKGSFSSGAQADAALAEVQRERTAIEAQFADAQYACYSKFFSSPCVDHAKERRRAALKQIREVEVDAEAFKRRERAAERDRALEQGAAREAAEAPEREAREQANQQKAAQRAAEREARMAAPPPKAAASATPGSKAAAPAPGRDRVAEHDAKMRAAETDGAAQASQRAQNVADYQRKQEEAKERQRRVAEKVAERERKLKESAQQAKPANPQPDGK